MKRKFLISVLLFGVFIVVCIYALVTAQGTQIDLDGNVVTTSILRVNSIPEDVTVYINDQKALRNENRVEWLDPGMVKVTLKKAGYRDWEKTLELRAGIIEDIYAQLYPERIDFEKLTSINVDNFYFPSNTDYIFYTVINGENVGDNGLWRLKLKRNLLDIGELVPSKVYTFSPDELTKVRENEYTLKITDDSTKVLFDIPALKELYYIDLNNPTPLSLGDIFSFYPTKTDWLRNSNMLIASNGSLLVSLDLNTRDQNLIYYSADRDIIYKISSNQVYYFRYDKELIYNLNGQQSNSVVLPSNYKGAGVISNIYTSEDNSDIFYTFENGNLHFVDLEKNVSFPFKDVKDVLSVASNGKSLIYISTDDKINSIVFKDSVDFKTYTYKINELTITQPALEKLFFTPSGQNIVVLTKDSESNKIVQFMDNDGTNSVNLITDDTIANNSIGVDDNGLAIYVILSDSSDLVVDSSINNIYKYNLVSE